MRKRIREVASRNLASTDPGLRMRDRRARLGVCSEGGKCWTEGAGPVAWSTGRGGESGTSAAGV